MLHPLHSSTRHHKNAIAYIKVTQPILLHSNLIMAVHKAKNLIWAVPVTAAAIGRDLTQFHSKQRPL
jgi:hypothetical protein